MPHVDGQEFCRRIKENPRTRAHSVHHAHRQGRTGHEDRRAELRRRRLPDQAVRRAESLQARVRSLLKLRGMHARPGQPQPRAARRIQRIEVVQNQLVQSEKMSSLGQLVAGLAHEINNSINAVYNGIKPLSAEPRSDWKCSLTTRLTRPAKKPGGRSPNAEVAALFQKHLLAGHGHRNRRHAARPGSSAT